MCDINVTGSVAPYTLETGHVAAACRGVVRYYSQAVADGTGSRRMVAVLIRVALAGRHHDAMTS